ncbi:MAG: hypothetical protein G01um101448_1148 [Parcubacteria group bacterium Gr01-1014_48]|nr:MAG: hypothetical protein G01um101448_1148 [Parcubacteria group bacterium Gr01-1014_48]
MNISDIKTVADLQNYVREQPSVVVADLINGALQFFMADCKLPNGKRDLEAIKERRMMGLPYRLREDEDLTEDSSLALINWMLFPGKGRDIGTDLLSAKLSHIQGVKNPREEALKILKSIRTRLIEEGPVF